jgi:2-polyprenyl-6-methoxyphenol hydroxylase-like FAD-dependent oxidoreductase
MRQAEVVIVGGGLAGSTAAAMLGRAGVDTVVVDPHEAYPPDFRCEKLDEQQIGLFEATGISRDVLRYAVHFDSLWIARRGRLLDKRPNHQFGIRYEDLVNRVRAIVPQHVPFIVAKAASLTTSSERQTVTLSTGEVISARLIVLANGLNIGLRHLLGLQRHVVSECHSISIGFDVSPSSGRFPFTALTYYPERVDDRLAYLSFFPVNGGMRANAFVYREMDDLWLRHVRQAPKQALQELLPGLSKVTGDFDAISAVRVRPVDLVVTSGHVQPGVALVGDAFSTSCPAAGTGAHKAFTDAGRLCSVHIPHWLGTPGMGADKIAAFYADPVKQASEAYSRDKAYYLRSLSTETSLAWAARRAIKFLGQLAVGTLRRAGVGSAPNRDQTAPQPGEIKAPPAPAFAVDELPVIQSVNDDRRVRATHG